MEIDIAQYKIILFDTLYSTIQEVMDPTIHFFVAFSITFEQRFKKHCNIFFLKLKFSFASYS